MALFHSFSTRHLLATLAAAALALGCAVPSPPVEAASGSGISMEILVGGVPIREYRHRGTTYIEARKNTEYAVRLVNHTGSRVAVALAVDGLNSIDARHTSPQDSAKWVIEPWGNITVSGWQVSGSDARRFYFTSEERSYGAYMGDTRNLGNISVAAFRQVPPPPPPRYEPPIYWEDRDGWSGDEEEGDFAAPRGGVGTGGSGRSAEKSAGAPAPSAPYDSGYGSERRADAPKAESRSRASRQPAPDSLAATGIGRRVDHAVSEVAMELESSPFTTVTVRYEYRNALVRLGVLPDRSVDNRLQKREGSSGFAPDPYGW